MGAKKKRNEMHGDARALARARAIAVALTTPKVDLACLRKPRWETRHESSYGPGFARSSKSAGREEGQGGTLKALSRARTMTGLGLG